MNNILDLFLFLIGGFFVFAAISMLSNDSIETGKTPEYQARWISAKIGILYYRGLVRISLYDSFLIIKALKNYLIKYSDISSVEIKGRWWLNKALYIHTKEANSMPFVIYSGNQEKMKQIIESHMNHI